MKRFYLIAALIALSGCSGNDVANELNACEADSMKNNVQRNDRVPFQRACMGGKGYEFTCVGAVYYEINLPQCFEKRGLIRDVRRFFRKQTQE